MAMTLQEIQDAISASFDYTGSSISSSSTEWTRRKRLINQAERTAKDFLKGQWSFLLKTATVTTTANVSTVSLPSDFVRSALAVDANGYVKINELLYKLVEKPETQNYDVNSRFVWITGNKSIGFTLNIQPTPADAYSINLVYYTDKIAVDTNGTDVEVLTSTTDETKIPDPYYIVDWVRGELYLIDDEPQTKWQPFKVSAQDRLIKMAANEAGDQNQNITIKLYSEEAGFDVFASDTNEND